MGLTNFALISAALWVRLNHFEPRYSAMGFAFTAIFTGLLLVEYKGKRKLWFSISASLVLFACLLQGITSSHHKATEKIAHLREIADQVPGKGCILIGDFWQIYPLAGVRPAKRSALLTTDHFTNKTPWVFDELKERCLVLVSSREPGGLIQAFGQYFNTGKRILRTSKIDFYEIAPEN